jgi:hypothetical protein
MEAKQPPDWHMLSNSLPPGVLANLRAAALKEMNHLILAYVSCTAAGDKDTANHCRKALKSVAASFEFSELSKLLALYEASNTAPPGHELLAVVQRWHLH